MNHNISDRQYIISNIRKNLSQNNQFVNTTGYSDRITPHFEENRPNPKTYNRDLYKYQKERANPFSETNIKKSTDLYQKSIQKIKENEANAFRLYELPRDFTLKQLKKRYMVLSKLTHPDKHGGSDEKFELVTKHYLYLLEYYKKHETSSKYERNQKIPMNSLVEKKKSNRKNQDEAFSKTSLKIGQGNKFDLNSFNKVFEKNVFYDQNREGYSSWLSKKAEEPEQQMRKYNKSTFNSAFDKQRQKMEKSIVPSSVSQVKCFNEHELSNMTIVDDNSNYTVSNTGAMDLKEVYTSGLINVSTKTTQKPQFKSQREYEQYRSSNMTPFNQQEKEELKQQEDRFQKKEKDRIHKLAERDAAISEHFMRIQGLLQ